jgi:hypothetical protein
MEKPDLSGLLNSLPPIVPRYRIEKYLPGIISRGYLQNLDSLGKGPRKVLVGRKVVYMREDLITWLRSRMTTENLRAEGI